MLRTQNQLRAILVVPKNYASPLVLSQETTMNVLFQIKFAQLMEAVGV